METVAVIGSNSFSGSHFIDFLLRNSEYNVIGISRSPEKPKLYLPYKRPNEPRFRFHRMDLNKDSAAILRLIDGKKPSFVVNFASQSMVGESWKNPEHWYNTNVLSTVKLTNALKEKKFLRKYVHVSTPEVYGTCSGSVNEKFPFNPSTPYAASRAAADVFIQLLVREFRFPAVFTRAANVYGPGQQLFRIIPRSIIYAKKGKKIPLHGGGVARRSFIHIRDVCGATSRIMEDAKAGEVYHLSTEKLHSVRGLVKIICDKMKVDFSGAVEDTKPRIGLDDAYILDSSKARREFGWKPEIDLDRGLDEVIGWIEDNWGIISKEPLEYMHKE